MNTTKKLMSAIAAIVLIVSVVIGSFAFKAKEANGCAISLKAKLESKGKLATYFFKWDPINNRYEEVEDRKSVV